MVYKSNVALLKKDKIVFEFTGTISQKILVSTLSSLENELQLMGISTNKIQSLTIVTIEMIQNIMNYSLDKSINEDGNYTSPGLYIVTYDSLLDVISLISSNKCDITKKDVISEKIDYINTLSKKEKRQFQREKLKDSRDSHKRGAGVGFIEIGKHSSHPIQYKFSKIDNDHYFEVNVTI